MVVLGCLLQQQKRARPPLWPSVFVLATRFVFMPALSLGLVYATAHRGWYSADPIVLFVLILIPCGPTALLLSSLSTLVDLDVGPVSGFITLSYLCSPLIAFTAALAFRVVDAVGQR
jgi:predicted permease